MTEPICRLYLVTPLIADADAFAPTLAAACKALRDAPAGVLATVAVTDGTLHAPGHTS